MSWTLQHASTTQSLAAWGITGVKIRLESLAASRMSFSVAGNCDAMDAWSYGHRLTLRDAANVVRFTGRVRQLPLAAQGNTESRQCVVEDVLGDLDRRTYVQGWKMQLGGDVATQNIPSVVLFGDAQGLGVGIGAQITAIVSAAAGAGVEVQLGSIAGGLTVVPHKVDNSSLSMLAALQAVSRMVPDLGTRVDYATTPPTVHFTRRASATEHNLDVFGTTDAFSAEALHDQQLAGVVLSYERTETALGVTSNRLYRDAAPAEADATAENVLVHHTKLAGASAFPIETEQTQQLSTTAIGSESFTWWETMWPALAGRNLAATLTAGVITGPSGVTRQITAGAQPGWTGSAAEVLVTAVFNGLIDGKAYVAKQLQAKVNASSLNSGNYVTSSVSGGGGSGGEALEPVPFGLAALLYAGLGVLHFRGSYQRTDAEPLWTVRPGDAVNFTGTQRAALATARAQVQAVECDLDNGVTRLEYGPPAHLSFGDLIELQRSLAKMGGETRNAERAGGGAAQKTTVTGAGMGPASSLILTPDDTNTHPFKVRYIGGNSFRVEAGQFQGYFIAASTLDVGGGRPMCIRIKAKFNVLISNGDWAYGATLDSGGGSAPSLEVSSYTTSDLTELSATGSGARCMLAVIGAGNVIGQLATANITCQINDSGAGDGTSTIVYDKD